MIKIPHTSAPKWPLDIAAARFSVSIRRDSSDGCQIALLGLPDDTGVKLNQGRPGAARGPGVFREALARYGVAEFSGGAWPRVFDAGDVIVTPGSLTETHARVTEAAAALVEGGLFPIAIGGGHDLTFPFVRAIAARCPNPVGLYFDA